MRSGTEEDRSLSSRLPVVMIGAGPVGLAAAVHLAARGQRFTVLEAGPAVGTHLDAWGHVQVFSPWRYNVDPLARTRLQHAGWTEPDPEALPTGAELVTGYLQPLAKLPELEAHIRFGARVTAVARTTHDKMKTGGRERAPFEVRIRTATGEESLLARAVIDASGTYESPNPLGGNGIAAIGEAELRDRIVYGIPDVRRAHRERYAGRHVLVVGSGHSAFNVLLNLAALAEEAPGTRITWAIRRSSLDHVFGGGQRDQLEERGRLGLRMHALAEKGVIEIVTSFSVSRLEAAPNGVVVHSAGLGLTVDTIVAATGFRPDVALLRELRLDLDPVVESPATLAPLIDPNVHSCGTVPPHGAAELRQPEKDFYVVGMKSYGRAPTFLMLTGYEQVRSVACALTGDVEGARDVRLALPETGVCSLAPTRSGCC